MTQELATVAESLVRRARQGDQNAVALISEVRRCASSGVAKAQESFAALQKYINENPMKEDEVTSIGRDNVPRAPKISGRAVQLANGPALSMSMSNDNPFMDSDAKTARAIQLVRMPWSRISDFYPMAGWEVGE